MTTLDPEFVLALVGAGLLCGVVNTLGSSGSALSLPLLILLGLPPTLANGTNRVAVVAAAAASLVAFQRRGLVCWRPTLRLGLPCVLGSLLGAWAAGRIDPGGMRWVVVAALVAALGILSTNPKRLFRDRLDAGQPEVRLQHYPLFFLIGVWAGLIVVDSGTQMLLALVLGAGFGFARANAAKAVLLLGVGVSSLSMFAVGGAVDWSCGLLLGIGSALGGRVAGRFASSAGARAWVPRLLLVVVTLELAQLGLRRVMWVHRSGPAEAQEGVGQERSGDAGQQAGEGPRAVPRQAQAVGELADGRLDPIAQGRHRAPGRPRQSLPLGLAVRVDHAGATPSMGLGPGAAEEASVEQQAGRGRPREQIIRDRALVHGGRDHAPSAGQAPAEVHPQAQAEALEPRAVRGIEAEAGVQARGPVPGVGPAHAPGMLDRQRRRVDLLPAVLRQGGHHLLSQQLAGGPQPAHPPVELALAGDVREVGPPLAPHLGHPRPLTRASQQMPHQGQCEHLGIRAHPGRTRAPRDRQLAAGHRIVDQDVDVDKQLSERHHPGRSLRARRVWTTPSVPPGAAPVQPTSRA
jgi:uncharacterized protein